MPAIAQITRIQNAVRNRKEGRPYNTDDTLDDLVEALHLMDAAIEKAHERIVNLQSEIKELKKSKKAK